MIYVRSQITLYEYWKPLPKPFLYQVSNWGGVGNVKTGQVLQPNLNDYRLNCQYLRVHLWGNGAGRFSFYVHRLVGRAWVPGETPERWQIDHLDGVKWNNLGCNLEWVTPQENSRRRDKQKLVDFALDNDAPF